MMPSQRRMVSRMQGIASTSNPVKLKYERSNLTNYSYNHGNIAGASNEEADEQSSIINNHLTSPKHSHIPEIPMDANFVFELMFFCNSMLGLGLQYVNLYKTVWWLPYSHASYALNFYLIDPYLAMFLILLMSRRVLWHLTQSIKNGGSRKYLYYLSQMFRFAIIICVFSLYLWTGYNVILRHSLLHVLYLGSPLITYVILFRFNFRPLFCKTVYSILPSSNDKLNKYKSPYDIMSSKETLHHACSTSPEHIREEVECLKTDFNHRIKQVLFNSMLCAYYVGFIPVCFAQNTLYYDTWWVIQHIVLIWIGSFIMFVVQFLPAKYVDVLHRCSLHLGKWVKVEGRNGHAPYTAWSELQPWAQGAMVKHVRGLFKAEGVNNSAEPGNGMHSRFYFIFHQPLRVTNWMLVLTWLLVIYQFFNLTQVSEWSHIVSLAVLPFANYWVLFKLMRDRMVLSRAYKESPILSKTTS